FMKENINPIKESGQLNFIHRNAKDQIGFQVLFMDGHTEKQMLPKIKYQDKTLVFMADLLPTVGHIPVPYVMGYDTRPLVTIKEKATFLNEAADNNYYLFLEHDAYNEICTVQHTEKGVRLNEIHKFTDIFN
ncbi:MAG: MBL fold metallo-hydrolase, partial [Polaribacter sp.]